MTATVELVTKACTKCKVPKLLQEFYVDRTSPDGHGHTCKECVRGQNSSGAAAQRALIMEARELTEAVRDLLEEIRAGRQ